MATIGSPKESAVEAAIKAATEASIEAAIEAATEAAIEAFALSLDRAAPPSPATPMLRALWHGLRGEWHAAHELAQAQDDAEGAWVHAWLHRIEGDLANADYWYQRARRPPRRDATRDEGLEIAAALIRSIESA